MSGCVELEQPLIEVSHSPGKVRPQEQEEYTKMIHYIIRGQQITQDHKEELHRHQQ
jgi:hypothetical protein